MQYRHFVPLVRLLVLAAVYVAAAEFGLSMASAHLNVSPFWPPTGIAIAAVLLLGYRVWPGILLGAFLVNLWTGVSVATSGGIATGNTLEAVSAALLLRSTGFRNSFERVQDVLKFALLAGLLSTAVSATAGNLSLCLGGAAKWENFGSLWLTWWLGDAGGALVVAPLLLTWGSKSVGRWSTKRYAEATFLHLFLAVVSMVVFGGWFPAPVKTYPIGHLTYPFLIWAAFRLGRRGVTLAVIMMSAIAIWGTAHGFGPFARETPDVSFLLLQAFISSSVVVSLVLVAVVEERVRLTVSEQAARNSAEAAGRIKDEFLATLSHELRTPLTAILGWARMLRGSSFDQDTAAHALEVIERNAKSQQQLIEDILDVSRVITGKLQLDVRPVDLVPVIEAATDTVRPAAEAKGIRLEAALRPEPHVISGDPVRLQQVVWNLLSNAVKFTPAGGRVTVRLERSDTHVEIAVSDTGGGISPEFLPFVFDHFRQADSTTTRQYGGLGLGLAIVRHLVEMHGGTVSVESGGPGQGATFTIQLPLNPTRLPEPQHDGNGSRADGIATGSETLEIPGEAQRSTGAPRR
jgi:signal transduction histidine kinase